MLQNLQTFEYIYKIIQKLYFPNSFGVAKKTKLKVCLSIGLDKHYNSCEVSLEKTGLFFSFLIPETYFIFGYSTDWNIFFVPKDGTSIMF